MGAAGGIRITNAKEIKDRWSEIKQAIKQIYKERAENSEYSKDYYFSACKKADNLPDIIESLTPELIVDLIRPFVRSCDTPYLFQNEFIITSEGYNVDSEITAVSKALGGDYIKTWT